MIFRKLQTFHETKLTYIFPLKEEIPQVMSPLQGDSSL